MMGSVHFEAPLTAGESKFPADAYVSRACIGTLESSTCNVGTGVNTRSPVGCTLPVKYDDHCTSTLVIGTVDIT